MNRTMSLRALAVVLLVAAACGDSNEELPPGGMPISRTEGTPIANATGWTWIPFGDAFCTDATLVSGAYQFSTSTTGLAINWGPPTNTDVVFFLEGGGACWDFVTCGGARAFSALLEPTASTGPFGPDEFANDIYLAYPSSWVRRERLPPSLADATIVFIPYCTGDVHAGDKVTTYDPPALLSSLPSITWHHVGHANVTAFLRRLGPTFTEPGKVIVAGSSAGGFGSLANYPAFRGYWPSAKSYLVDDSGPPLAGDAIPAETRAAWYASWNMGASLDSFCPECRTDMSAGMARLAADYPGDRIALLSHLRDGVISGFFGTYSYSPPSFSPMDPAAFETALRSLGADVMDPATGNAKYFFTLGITGGTGHPTLDDPTDITTPDPGLESWLELMLSDSTSWASASD
jgi:hypothetical protein